MYALGAYVSNQICANTLVISNIRIIRGGYTPNYSNPAGGSRFSATGTQPGAGALSRPVLPIGNGRGRRCEIDWRARGAWLVKLARDLGLTRDDSRWCLEGNDGNRASDNRSTGKLGLWTRSCVPCTSRAVGVQRRAERQERECLSQYMN